MKSEAEKMTLQGRFSKFSNAKIERLLENSVLATKKKATNFGIKLFNPFSPSCIVKFSQLKLILLIEQV